MTEPPERTSNQKQAFPDWAPPELARRKLNTGLETERPPGRPLFIVYSR
jgi:hypothetical protein